jgi:NADH:ubiquinone oxidoreductase subunit 6 (subunit J)
LSFAEFVAITQILIYAGGVVVVILFGIMLTSKISGKPLEVSNANVFSGLLASISLLTLLVIFIPDFFEPSPDTTTLTENSIQNIGINFMTTYALPFEISAILLLVSLIGAAVISSLMKTKKA